jgi:hypothetical protein
MKQNGGNMKSQMVNHIKEYNRFINRIQSLLKSYSIREVVKKYDISIKIVRLASEMRNIKYSNNIPPQIIWELRKLSTSRRNRWINTYNRLNWNAKQLRKALHKSKWSDIKIKINKAVRQEWLNKKKE